MDIPRICKGHHSQNKYMNSKGENFWRSCKISPSGSVSLHHVYCLLNVISLLALDGVCISHNKPQDYIVLKGTQNYAEMVDWFTQLYALHQDGFVVSTNIRLLDSSIHLRIDPHHHTVSIIISFQLALLSAMSPLAWLRYSLVSLFLFLEIQWSQAIAPEFNDIACAECSFVQLLMEVQVIRAGALQRLCCGFTALPLCFVVACGCIRNPNFIITERIPKFFTIQQICLNLCNCVHSNSVICKRLVACFIYIRVSSRVHILLEDHPLTLVSP